MSRTSNSPYQVQNDIVRGNSPDLSSSRQDRKTPAGHTPVGAPRAYPVLPLYEEEHLFAAGVQNLRDLIAPSRVEVDKRAIYVEYEGRGRYIRYFSITGFPRRLNAGWVEDLTGLKLPMQVVFHFSPFDPGIIIRQLESRLTQLESNRLMNNRALRLEKAEIQIGAEDIRRIMLGVEQGVVRIFSVSLTIGLHASSEERLDQRTNFLLTHLRQHRLKAQSMDLLHDTAWQTCSPLAKDTLFKRANLDNSSLAMCFPFTSASIGTPDGAFLGIAANGEPVFFNPWSRKKRIPNANIVVCGASGQGKSYFTKKLTLGLMATGDVDCVVIDRDGDYDPLCLALGSRESQRINLAHGCPINPFDLPFVPADVEQRDRRSNLLAEYIDNSIMAFLGMLIADSALSKQEEAILYQAMVDTYAGAGITSSAINRDPNTLLRPAPLFEDLARTLKKLGNRDAFSLVERLEKPSYLFQGETSISLQTPLTVFSIAGLDESLYPLMIYTVKNFLARNRAQLRYERFLLYLIEEASFMLRHPLGRKYLEQTSRGVRKQGIAQVTISQHPSDFLEDGKIIVANAGTCFFLGMEMSAIEKLKLTPQLERVLAAARPGELVCRIGNEYAHFRVVASPEEHKLFTTDPFEQMKARRAAQ